MVTYAMLYECNINMYDVSVFSNQYYHVDVMYVFKSKDY